MVSEWTPEALQQLGEQFEGRPPEEVLRWGIQQFAPDIAMATGFGPEGVVLLHQLSQLAPETTIFYLDTDLFFPETVALRDELEARFGMSFTRVQCGLSLEAQAEAHGSELWARDPDRCCHLRKVEPLRRFLSTQRAWITAIRRNQTAARAGAGLVEWDRAHGLVKFNPLVGWTSDQVWDYIHAHDLPFNRLHVLGYPSIGCWPCTRPVAPGDDPRAGRWAGLGKTECGIHWPARK
ncbi:MAG TPA: phosphoadenylyl-sulfate reductase [Anaerolineae bacterium]|nr:phosphoadenylyl-sulfate reductase [Anaerolineae bacterium]